MTMSMCSQKSASAAANRSRMYHIDPRNPGETDDDIDDSDDLDDDDDITIPVTGALNSGYVPEDARSHISQFSTRSRSRSEHGLFGQSQRYPSRNGE